MDGRALNDSTQASAGHTSTARRLSPEARAAILTLVGGALALAGLILLAGESPARVLTLMLREGFLTLNGLGAAATRAIPLCLIALGLAASFRAGIYNIGADGQLAVGTAVAVACAGSVAGLPFGTGIALLLIAAMLGGAAWGAVAGLLKVRFGANEIVTTIMLNYIAANVIGWLVRGPIQEPMRMFPRTARLPEILRLPILFEGTRISAGLIVALLAVVILWFLLTRTRYGFSLAVMGLNSSAARFSGLSRGRLTGGVLALSGAMAGLAGIVEVLGLHGRLQEGFAPGFGITAITVALLARLNPLLIPVAALGLGGLYVGSAAVARDTAVPFPLVSIIEAAVIFGFLLISVLRRKA
ncbi:ABC transporter permease [Pseudaminobacter soli (ex Li et al. 2025)]|uniref:Sugar ABC transporter permease n=1 Tax=Pseudaminobacter soli (ex Li et al. 2025) TaxID=1295366 RepID=A0A2P7S306_9HYPH|nr:ABC transporter permease [Mesorhizobium soli]PSJ56867.1 sugar ABC transporter permease [Mesorhizobium soli]